MRAEEVKQLAIECGFDLAGVVEAGPVPEHAGYADWVHKGMAAGMRYLTDRRGDVRADVRNLLPTARSVICAGKLYNIDAPYSTDPLERDRAWISRYAWCEDYHEVLRNGLERLAALLPPCDSKICVDTAPLLERALARRAGLGWIGKNTCLIHEGAGSWFVLGELITSLELEPDSAPPDRCGTCRKCIDACPTAAIVPTGKREPAWAVDSRLCISYFTIEERGAAPEAVRERTGQNVFGCDICQDVCPWNRRAAVTRDPAFTPREVAPPLEKLAALTEQEFRTRYSRTPVSRARYAGFLRNVATAMGNSGLTRFRKPLERLARHADEAVREHARWALSRLERA